MPSKPNSSTKTESILRLKLMGPLSNRGSAASDQVDDQHDHSDNEQQVNQTSGDVKTEAQKPQNQQNYEKCPKHRRSPPTLNPPCYVGRCSQSRIGEGGAPSGSCCTRDCEPLLNSRYLQDWVGESQGKPEITGGCVRAPVRGFLSKSSRSCREVLRPLPTREPFCPRLCVRVPSGAHIFCSFDIS